MMFVIYSGLERMASVFLGFWRSSLEKMLFLRYIVFVERAFLRVAARIDASEQFSCTLPYVFLAGKNSKLQI